MRYSNKCQHWRLSLDQSPSNNGLTRRSLLGNAGKLIAASTLPISLGSAESPATCQTAAPRSIMGTLSTYMPEAIDRALPDFASRDPDPYTTADREFMVVDGRQMAIAVENALAFEEDDKLRK